MAHDVFISYSHHDKPTADAICAKFESEGLRCWYAPRDIAPGEDWASAIIDGIKASKVFLIVFTGHSNGSQQVLREINAAVSQGIPIIPFRLTDTVPSKGMEYYLSTVHWLDATDGQLYENIKLLGNRVRAVLGAEGQPEEEPNGSGLSPASGTKHTGDSGGNNKTWIYTLAAVLVLAITAVILWQAGVFGGQAPEETSVPDVIAENVTEPETEAAPETENTAATAEEISEKPTEIPTEAPTDAPTDMPTDASTEATVEITAEVQTEVPAEAAAQNDYPELRNMSEAKRKAVKRLIIAGDQVVFNFVHEDYYEHYDPESQKSFLSVKEEEKTEVYPGTLADLSLLEGMDNLEVLYLVNQPLRSLDGIEKLQNLSEVRICDCDNLEDISPLLQLENLICLNLMGNHLKTIGSFEKFKQLDCLWIMDHDTEDLSGLSDWNATSPLEEEGVILRLECPRVSDYSFLKKIPGFRELRIYKGDAAAWVNELSQSRIQWLDFLDNFNSQEDFETLVSGHPELTRLELRHAEAITDLSSLVQLPNLTYVGVSSEMWDAICSLDGVDYKFELAVD